MPFIGKQSTSNSQITNYTTTVSSGGQTNFTVVIEGGDETHVYLNGVLLKETTDYTVSSTQVSLVSPAVENDIVEIKVFRSFALVDAVKATGGTFSGDVAVTGNVSATGNIQVDDIVEKTSAHGVEIDGVTLKDGGGTFTSNDGVIISGPSYATLRLEEGDATDLNTTMFNSSGAFSIYTTSDDRSSSTQRLDVNHTSGDVKIYTGNLVFGGANKGITFQDVANASTPVSSGNTLDHFEEGDFDVGTTTSSGESYNNCKYVRIGQLVFVQIYVEWTNGLNNNGSTFQITGLPFTPQGNNNYAGASIGYVGGANMNDALGIVSSGSNHMYFHQNDGSSNTLKNSDIHSRGLSAIIISTTYYAN